MDDIKKIPLVSSEISGLWNTYMASIECLKGMHLLQGI